MDVHPEDGLISSGDDPVAVRTLGWLAPAQEENIHDIEMPDLTAIAFQALTLVDPPPALGFGEIVPLMPDPDSATYSGENLVVGYTSRPEGVIDQNEG